VTWWWDWQLNLLLLLTFFPGALVHELGHILGLWAAGGSGFTIRFGRPGGRVTWSFRLGALTFVIHPGLGLWFHAPRAGAAQVRYRTPWRRLVWVLGGPAASALLFAAFWPGAWADVIWWPARFETWQELAQWWGLWGVVVPLFPLRYPSGHASDGLQVIQVLRAGKGPGDVR
jgi:hypothetical protein